MATVEMSQTQVRELLQGAAKKNKYGVRIDNEGKAQRTYKGCVYASLAEARQAALLDLQITAGEVASWTRQPRFPLVVNGQKVAVYVADFHVIYPDGQEEVVDVKGHVTPVAKLKMALYDALRRAEGWPCLTRVQT